MTVAPGRSLSRRVGTEARELVRPPRRPIDQEKIDPLHVGEGGGRVPQLFVAGHLDGLQRSVSYLHDAQSFVLQKPSDGHDPVRRVLQRDQSSFAHSAERSCDPHRGSAAAALDNDLRLLQQDVTDDLVHGLG